MMLLKLHAMRLIKPFTLKSFVDENVNRSFSRDVITFQNLKTKVPPKFLSSSGKGGGIFISIHNRPFSKMAAENSNKLKLAKI